MRTSIPTYRFLRAALLIPLASGRIAFQELPLRDLPEPSTEISEPLTFVTASRVLRDGTLAVIDGSEPQLYVVDFATGRRTALGRKGAGPGEYTSPTAVFQLPGDTILVLDAQVGRFVSFLPNHRAGPVFGFPTGMNLADSTTLLDPMQMDARGRLFANALRIRGVTVAPTASGDPQQGRVNVDDSTTLVRLNPHAPAARAPIGRLRYAKSAAPLVQAQGDHTLLTMTFGGLTPIDSWTVWRDGTIAIVRGATYRIEFFKPDGSRGSTTTIPYARMRVAEREKQLLLAQATERLKSQPWIKQMSAGGREIQVNMVPPNPWPAEYPSIAPGGVMPAPDGRLWVQRPVSPTVGRQQWDVVDQSGKVVARWQLAPRTTLVGLGDGFAFSVRMDDDDLRHLQRTVLPRSVPR